MPIRIELDRLDAHAGDVHGRQRTVEVPGQSLLSDVLTTVLEPFLERSPRATWVCRAVWNGQHRDVAEVVVAPGTAEPLSSRLLVADDTLGVFLGRGQTSLSLSCRPDDQP